MVLARSRRPLLAVAAAATLLLGLSASIPARAGDDGEAPLWKSLGGMIGLTDSDKVDDQIKYDERARLVLPPSTDLPPPAAANPTIADWPQDPDVLRVKKARDEKLHHVNRSPSLDRASLHGRPLSPDLLRSDKAPPGSSRSTDACQRDPRNCHWIGATVLEKLGIKKDRDAVVAGQEPDREWLTDPPKGYRMPLANTKATFDAKPRIDAGDARTTLFVPPSQ